VTSSGTSAPRLVVVLGYSGPAGELHEICSARLRRAELEAAPADVVLLSGWSRRRRQTTEAALMARDWRGSSSRMLLDEGARTTLSNAVGAARVARNTGAREIVLVTSGWHAKRAAALLEAALDESDVSIRLAVTDEPGGKRARLREVACWTLVPVQRRVAAARARPRKPADGARVEAV
jgi:uncharacterized SAM-binding protein YcdF (DUF218 family)